MGIKLYGISILYIAENISVLLHIVVLNAEF